MWLKRGLADDKVNQSAFDNDTFLDGLASHSRSYVGVCRCEGLNFLVAQTFGNHHFRLDFAVDLYGVFYFRFDECRLVYLGVALFQNADLVAHNFPKLFAKMRGKRRKHTD